MTYGSFEVLGFLDRPYLDENDLNSGQERFKLKYCPFCGERIDGMDLLGDFGSENDYKE